MADKEHPTDKAASGSPASPQEAEAFPIVGLGASAGGLEAFTRFFEALPEAPGMAFVLIQHLDPNHESMMPDLLSRHTALEVLQVKKRTRVEKDTVYIIPPGKYLGLENQHLVLSEQPPNRGMRMSIDHFFETLAKAQREKAICIILSGTASDGTLGMKAVKANGGLAIVQDPETAQYDGMPRSAISTGAVDRILAPEDMPQVLLEYAEHPYVNGRDHKQADDGNENGDRIEKVLAALHAQTGQEFKGYKKSTLTRRIQRRMSLNHIVRLDDYLERIRSSEKEAEALFKDLLINVTSFFRDTEAWDTLADMVLPALVERSDRSHPIRVWTPGCATGEEAYSIAMLLLEVLDRKGKRGDIQIFGTDIDKDAFHIARKGRYPAGIAADVSQERLDRFFDKEQDVYVVKKHLREAVVFAPQSLINDPPFSNLDLIICRNLLIYLEPDIQSKILGLFHFALKEGGYLFLGNSETIGTHKNFFEPVSKSWRIYKRLGGGRSGHVEMPLFKSHRGREQHSDGTAAPRERRMSIAAIAQQAVLQHQAPPCVLVDRNFDVLYYHGNTAEFLKQPEGEPTRSLIDQAPPEMRTKLRWLLHHSLESGEPQQVRDVNLRRENGSHLRALIEATPLRQPPEADGLILITFRHDPAPTAAANVLPQNRVEIEGSDNGTVRHLEYELKVTREELQSTIEELEASNEELKASNEEAMSMNEELQSGNEELETNKEELQSLNEELTTVNNELREKVRELEEANNDLANLLSNTHIPTVFLHRDLRIKRFTPAATELMRLVPSDIGRSFDHIARRFEDADLIPDIRTVLKNLAPREKEIHTDKDQWYTRRILPYRTQDDRIIGVVLTFLDITQKRRHLEEIQAREDQLRRAIMEAPLPVILYAEDQEILMLSRTWTEITGYTSEELTTLSEWIRRAYGSQAVEVQQYIEKIVGAEERLDEGEWTIRTQDGQQRIWHFHSAPLGRLPDGRRMVIGMAIDMTSRRRMEAALKRKEEELEAINASLEKKVSERTRSLEEKQGQLQKLASELSQAEQRERRKLASTLHDHLQQLIAAARMRMENMEDPPADEGPDTLEQVRQLLEEAALACRNISVELAPPVLYDAGFSPALHWLCKWFREQHALAVTCDIETVRIDQDLAVMLFQSVKELLFNVVKHAGTGKALLTAKTDNDGNLAIRVSDQGRGFDLATTAGDGNENNGFGLFSIQERIQIARGRVEVETAPGEGVAITIVVPLEEDRLAKTASEDAAIKRFPPARSNGSAGDDEALRILIVDDHQIFREGLRSLLESNDHLVVAGEAADGEEAVAKSHELAPDVVLMDINMPRMNGLEATRRIAAELPQIRIIGLSVNAKDNMAEAMLGAGAAAYLTKGGPSQELLAEIAKARKSTP